MAKSNDKPKTVGRETGNRYEPVKEVVRDKSGRIVSQPSDVEKVGEEVAVEDEKARESGEV